MNYNYHTHTHWCDHASGTPEEYIENAVAVFPETECGYDGKNIKLSFEE